MEARIKRIISETSMSYLRSGRAHSEFYDITLSIIAWLVLSSERYDKTIPQLHLADSSFFFNLNKEQLKKQDIMEALNRWEDCNKPLFTGLLKLETKLINDIPDDFWQLTLRTWGSLFEDFSIRKDSSLILLIFDCLERTFTLDQKNDNIHLTPKALAGVMSNYIASQDAQTLYDPFAGSGNLLSEALQNLPVVKSVTGFVPMKLAWKLAKLRLLLLRKSPGFDILIESGYQKAPFSDKKFDVIISNPPFGGQLQTDLYSGIGDDWYDLARKSNRHDVVFLCHILSRLAEGGRASLLLPGIFLSGNTVIKELIRRMLKNNLLEAVIALPQGLFANTSIATVLFCIHKDRGEEHRLLIADASGETDKNGKQAILRSEKILGWVEQLRSSTPYIEEKEEELMIMVSAEDVAAKDYNLYVSTYKQKKTFISQRKSSEKLKQEYRQLEDELDKVKADLAAFLLEE